MGPCTLLPPAGQTDLSNNLHLGADTWNSTPTGTARASLSQRQAWMEWARRISFPRALATSGELNLGDQITWGDSPASVRSV